MAESLMRRAPRAASDPRRVIAERPHHLLVLDADRTFAAAIDRAMCEAGWRVDRYCPDARIATALRDVEADCAVLDPSSFHPLDGLAEVVQLLARRRIPFIVAASNLNAASAAALTRAGALDCFAKPIELRDLRERVLATLQSPNGSTADRESASPLDPPMRRVLATIDRAAASNAALLLSGETGTGKSYLARRVHDGSPRRSGPFVTLACGSLVPALAGSELFGHVRGAFSDATRNAPGRLATAEGGTLLLDDIDLASTELQQQLLRVLDCSEYEPVGSGETRRANVRFLATTNADLVTCVAAGRFREDLFHRLNVIAVEVPPLRERPNELAVLAERFLHEIGRDVGMPAMCLSDTARSALASYRWPGNVRELKHAVERAALLTVGRTIEVSALPPAVRAAAVEADREVSRLSLSRAAADRAAILTALEQHGWNRQQTAAALGIERTTLYKRMRALGIPMPTRAA